MMYENERRRAISNAASRLYADGCELVHAAVLMPIPVITIKFPTVMMEKTATAVRERKDGKEQTSYITKLSGCIVKWTEEETQEQAAQLTENLNPYSPELIAHWPANL